MLKTMLWLILLASNIFALSQDDIFYIKMNALANSKTEYDLSKEKVAIWYMLTFEKERYYNTVGKFEKLELFEEIKNKKIDIKKYMKENYGDIKNKIFISENTTSSAILNDEIYDFKKQVFKISNIGVGANGIKITFDNHPKELLFNVTRDEAKEIIENYMVSSCILKWQISFYIIKNELTDYYLSRKIDHFDFSSNETLSQKAIGRIKDINIYRICGKNIMQHRVFYLK